MTTQCDPDAAFESVSAQIVRVYRSGLIGTDEAIRRILAAKLGNSAPVQSMPRIRHLRIVR